MFLNVEFAFLNSLQLDTSPNASGTKYLTPYTAYFDPDALGILLSRLKGAGALPN